MKMLGIKKQHHPYDKLLRNGPLLLVSTILISQLPVNVSSFFPPSHSIQPLQHIKFYSGITTQTSISLNNGGVDQELISNLYSSSVVDTIRATSPSITTSTTAAVDVLGPTEILDGFLWGVGLALSYAYLQYKTGATFFVPWQPPPLIPTPPPSSSISCDETEPFELRECETRFETNTTIQNIQTDNDDDESSEIKSKKSSVFDAKSWKEISRPENYVFYNRRFQTRQQQEQQETENLVSLFSFFKPKTISSNSNSNNDIKPKKEKKIILISLLVLFVPIFSIEFFFALSRQFMCGNGDPFNQPSWAAEMCSPHFFP